MEFYQLNLHPLVMQGLNELGFTTPTPVQEQVIPEAMQGIDIRACAQTGTGKTMAFVLPALHRLLTHPTPHNPAVLVMVPTRELAAQVARVVLEAGKYTNVRSVLILGGANFERQVRGIQSGAQIVVATPGRLLDHLRRRTITLKNIQTLVLDEADRMLDMGFLPDIRAIMSACTTKKQTMLFSATFPREIQQLVSSFFVNPKTVDLAPSVPANTVTQMIYPVSSSQKEALLYALIDQANISSALVFCRTKHGADRVGNGLRKIGKSVTILHSNRSQSERNEALAGFSSKKYQIMVATDIASRGIDIKEISHVINYDVPQHPEDYVHRIGRTGRAEATGDAFTIVSPDEEPYLKRIERYINKTLPRGVLPNFPYLVPPRLIVKPKPLSESFGRFRRRIPTSRHGRFR
jgi:ATP-dependent RNA helicase RhlE